MPIGITPSSIFQRLKQTLAHAVLAILVPLVPQAIAVETVSLLTEAPTLETAEALYNSGQYEQAVQYASQGQELDSWIISWEITKARSHLALGQYEEAYQSLEAFVEDRPYEIRPRLLLREAALFTGRPAEAGRQFDALGYLVNERSRRYGYDPENLVAIGQIALLYQVEPKVVLDNFYRRAQGFTSKPVSSFLAAGTLALTKDDYKLASKTFQQGLEIHPDNVELLHGLASSYREGDRSQLIEYANQALTINARHAPTLILLAEHLIAAESYDAAEQNINIALETNPSHPHALALKAVLAYIRNDSDGGDQFRAAALSTWAENPEVDYQIGRQLSRKYRFSDAASHQRIALGLDSTYNPARIQLAQDLLRLGQNDEAWVHADAVHESDPYNISAFNLATLRDRLDDFTTIESEHFVIKMSSKEASVYGPRAVRVLEEAHANLTQSYAIELPQKTTVEIYPNPVDFETRTFGIPGNPGYLGVCFGPVFTINSPATRLANWEAVLYHEFCHTITLTLTNNRMPRWLSEGISVYEERVANKSWGQQMTASYRNRILSEQMQPISSMSSAFLQASDGEDIQFAYYQSYLVVEYIIKNHGATQLRDLLVELGKGTEINAALAIHLAPLETLDSGFAEFAKEEAAKLAPEYRFDSPEGPLAIATQLMQPKEDYKAKLQRGKDYLAAEEWSKAIEELEALVEKAGYLPAAENAHWPLSQSYQAIGDTEKESAILKDMVRHEGNKLAPVTRLLELARDSGSSNEILQWSSAWLAINPMAETPWRSFLKSSKALDLTPEAIEAASALLALDAPDKPALNYQLAQLNHSSAPTVAKRHVLEALEEAPRFVEAYRLLKDLQADIAKQTPNTPPKGLDLNNDFTQ